MVKISLSFLAEISSWLQHTEFFVQNGPWVFLEAEIFWVFWALSFFETGKKRACIKAKFDKIPAAKVSLAKVQLFRKISFMQKS